MDDLRSTDVYNYFQNKSDVHALVENDSANVPKPRRKPGPHKKEHPRSEKISCRLTEEEKEAGERYCKEHGITEANLLRASYLVATLQTRNQMNGIANAILDLIKPGSNPIEHRILKEKIVTILRKSGLFVLLILFGIFLSSAPTVAKYFLTVYEVGKAYIVHSDEAWITHDGESGWEVVPWKWVPAPPPAQSPPPPPSVPPPSHIQPQLPVPTWHIPVMPRKLPEPPNK